MKVYGLMQVFFDEHGDFDSEVYSPLYRDKDMAKATMAMQKKEEGSRWQLVTFDVI